MKHAILLHTTANCCNSIGCGAICCHLSYIVRNSEKPTGFNRSRCVAICIRCCKRPWIFRPTSSCTPTHLPHSGYNVCKTSNQPATATRGASKVLSKYTFREREHTWNMRWLFSIHSTWNGAAASDYVWSTPSSDAVHDARYECHCMCGWYQTHVTFYPCQCTCAIVQVG